MYELFLTWKQPLPTGEPLFPNEPMKKIDDFLLRARSKQMELQMLEQQKKQQDLKQQAMKFMANVASGGGGIPQQSKLANEVNQLLDLTNQRKLLDPHDSDAQKQVDILNQLKSILSTQTLPSVILPRIQQQLLTFSQQEMQRLNDLVSKQQDIQRTVAAAANANTNTIPAPNSYAANPYAAPSYPSNSYTTNSYPSNLQPANPLASLGLVMNSNGRIVSSGAPAQPVPHPSLSDSNKNISNILSGLDFSRLTSTPPFSSQPPSKPHTPISSVPDSGLSASLIQSLSTAGLINLPPSSTGPTPVAVSGIVIQVELTNASIQTPHMELIKLLYDELPNVCSTCGKRFADTETGHKDRKAHLDWHFRVNKRLRDDNRAQNRCWYLTEEEWINYKDEDEILGLVNQEMPGDDSLRFGNDSGNDNERTGRGLNNGDSSVKSSKKGSKSKVDVKALSAKFVLVPSDKHVASLPCPICKEKFNSVWNDKEEAWVWMNSVEDQGIYFHAICHAEAGPDLIKRIVDGDSKKRKLEDAEEKENVKKEKV